VSGADANRGEKKDGGGGGGDGPVAGMLNDRMSHRKVDSQKTAAGVPEIICTALLQLSRSLTRNRAKLADSRADAMMVNSTSSRSPARGWGGGWCCQPPRLL